MDYNKITSLILRYLDLDVTFVLEVLKASREKTIDKSEKSAKSIGFSYEEIFFCLSLK